MNITLFAKMADAIRRSLTPCILCHSPSQYSLCHTCQDSMFKAQVIRCRCCGNLLSQTIFPATRLCGDCLKEPPAYDTTVTITDFVPPVDQIVHMLKFQHCLAVAPVIGRLLYLAMITHRIQPDLLVAVPLGPKRLAERGFNQSHEIAKTVGKLLKMIPQRSLLVRTRETDRQSDITTIASRKKNIYQAFSVPDTQKASLQGCHIAVVDDVMTTGNTLNEIGRVLKQAGATKITNLVFARTPKHLIKASHV